MKQSETHDNFKANNYLSEWKANHKFIEMGQARRVKLHVARLVDVIDDKITYIACIASTLKSKPCSKDNRF
ncbi:hypothetical protein [Candidatus Nitrotoga sp. 1052]|uniref:hypothetical protein n=1 Tax=Candidatus Nitrotoga sp. 1052 TaxID=2886964 RepID=UPI001EF66E86|nr:hypothetical protein [Candidatus Nitrotoga sp. 1052]CAH1090358.1 hypothetical protein NTG1052_770007 [Candidatus Nitrotoga sp. 1052]